MLSEDRAEVDINNVFIEFCIADLVVKGRCNEKIVFIVRFNNQFVIRVFF